MSAASWYSAWKGNKIVCSAAAIKPKEMVIAAKHNNVGVASNIKPLTRASIPYLSYPAGCDNTENGFKGKTARSKFVFYSSTARDQNYRKTIGTCKTKQRGVWC